MSSSKQTTGRSSFKRKHGSNGAAKGKGAVAGGGQPPAKKVKQLKAATLGGLPWQRLTLPSDFAFDDEGGLMALDEVKGVQIEYENGVARFKIPEDAVVEDFEDEIPFAPEDAVEPGEDDEPLGDEDLPTEAVTTKEAPEKTAVVAVKEDKPKKKKKKVAVATVVTEAPADDFDPETSLPAWTGRVHPVLLRALHELQYTKPTPIQDKVLDFEPGKPQPAAEVAEDEDEWGGIQSDEDEAPVAGPSKVTAFKQPEEDGAPNGLRDIVGIAQTGSGKTFAYGLPILSSIFAKQAAVAASNGDSKSKERIPMSALILCPTRELTLQVRAALADIVFRTNAVIGTDAAGKPERERKHWVNVVALTGGMSVEKQKRQLSKGAEIVVATPGRLWDVLNDTPELARDIKRMDFLVVDEVDRMIENGHFAELEHIVRLTRRTGQAVDDDIAPAEGIELDTKAANPDMRTFVFSATMSRELQKNVKKKYRVSNNPSTNFDQLLNKVDFRDPDPVVIDLSTEGTLVETLKECKVECLLPEKDVHLYHFLLRYPGRTIVFLSAIDGIRRLHPLLVLLQLPVFPLHSGMQQTARLKALDRFKASDRGILLATDVAARGLDIAAVSHVVHFQLPRSADAYVHRSGRTARAGEEGIALQLVTPEEKKTQRLLFAKLGRSPSDLPELPTDYSILDQLAKRVALAKKLESAAHKAEKEAHDETWLKKAAQEMEIDIDSGDESDNTKAKKTKRKEKNAWVRGMKAELQDMLSQPVLMRGLSKKYITTRGRADFVDQLVNGTNHETLFGIGQSTALEDLAKTAKKSTKA